MCIRDRALNEGHEFSLTEGDVWYPWVRFYEEHKLPTNEKKKNVKMCIRDSSDAPKGACGFESHFGYKYN